MKTSPNLSIPFVNRDPSIQVGINGISEFFPVYSEKNIQSSPNKYAHAKVTFWTSEGLETRDVVVQKKDIPQLKKTVRSNQRLAFESFAQVEEVNKINVTVDAAVNNKDYFDRFPITVKCGPPRPVQAPRILKGFNGSHFESLIVTIKKDNRLVKCVQLNKFSKFRLSMNGEIK